MSRLPGPTPCPGFTTNMGVELHYLRRIPPPPLPCSTTSKIPIGHIENVTTTMKNATTTIKQLSKTGQEYYDKLKVETQKVHVLSGEKAQLEANLDALALRLGDNSKNHIGNRKRKRRRNNNVFPQPPTM